MPDENVYDIANYILKTLYPATKLVAPDATVLGEQMGLHPDAAAKYDKLVDRKCKTAGAARADTRIWISSKSYTKRILSISIPVEERPKFIEVYNDALKLLKSEKRMEQLGPGVGKAFLVFDDTPLVSNEKLKKLIDPTDPEALLAALAEQVKTTEAERLQHEQELAQKEEKIKEAEKKVASLAGQLNSNARTTWT